jgi:prophage regulatory protein
VTTPTANLYLSVEQVAIRFGVSKDSIWRWRRDGEFPAPVKLDGRTTRWRLADIEDWESQCVSAFAMALRFRPESAFFG